MYGAGSIGHPPDPELDSRYSWTRLALSMVLGTIGGVGLWSFVVALPSVQGAYFLLFMAFFREISSAMLLYTSATSVISVSIWSFFEQANWGEASALSVIATLIIFIAMSLILWLSPTSRRS